MKGLILNDIYNITHNVKSMLLLLGIFAVFLIPGSGVISYVITAGILCSMMIITTFNFDESSKWPKYALVMPISKKDYVNSKFVSLLIFCITGVLGADILGAAVGSILGKFNIFDVEGALELLAGDVLAIFISFFFGSITIPFLFKYGAEKARIISMCALLVPILFCFVIYYLLKSLGIAFSENMISLMLLAFPVVAVVLSFLMRWVSISILEKKEV